MNFARACTHSGWCRLSPPPPPECHSTHFSPSPKVHSLNLSLSLYYINQNVPPLHPLNKHNFPCQAEWMSLSLSCSKASPCAVLDPFMLLCSSFSVWDLFSKLTLPINPVSVVFIATHTHHSSHPLFLGRASLSLSAWSVSLMEELHANIMNRPLQTNPSPNEQQAGWCWSNSRIKQRYLPLSHKRGTLCRQGCLFL